MGNEVLVENAESVVDETTQDRTEAEVPEKFKGKSLEDIIDSYKNLERELGRKGQEIGELRRLTDQLLQKEATRDVPSQKEPEVDFFDDPKAAVKKLLQEELAPLKERLTVSDKKSAMAQLNELHPDWKEVITTKDFQEWVAASNVRRRLYAEADAYDFDSANELLSTWKTLRQVDESKKAVEDEEKKRQKALKSAASESGRTGESSKKVYRRADLIRLKMQDPSRYADLQDDIMEAYRDGRVR